MAERNGIRGLGPGLSPLRGLPVLRRNLRRRASSWDRTGGNDDYVLIPPGGTHRLAAISGAGCITHLWMTLAGREAGYLRKTVLRMWWDGQAHPSVESPVGDFFGVGFGEPVSFASLPLAASPQDGRGLNCFFPMPFASGARIELESRCQAEPVRVYYYVDYELYPALEPDVGRFHAWWRRERCSGDPARTHNLTGAENYLILEAEGWGHFVGCVLHVENLTRDAAGRSTWYGEGDDMIFLDGEPFPPSLHGTGTEDYFNLAWCPNQAYSAPYHGIPRPGGPDWSGRITLYRFHIEDPIVFSRSIRVTIEHGHANDRSDEYASTAYWYQALPSRPFPPLADLT